MKNKQFEICEPDFCDGHLLVAHSGDFPGNVVISTPDEKSKESYGKIHIDLPAKMMRELGQALIEMADEAEKAQMPTKKSAKVVRYTHPRGFTDETKWLEWRDGKMFLTNNNGERLCHHWSKAMADKQVGLGVWQSSIVFPTTSPKPKPPAREWKRHAIVSKDGKCLCVYPSRRAARSSLRYFEGTVKRVLVKELP